MQEKLGHVGRSYVSEMIGARKLRNDSLLIYEWSPDILRMELDRYI